MRTMAIIKGNVVVFFAIASAFLFLSPSPPSSVDAHPLAACGFDRIYQLGDSISDTGNLIREYPIGVATPFARLPYGETFFHKATGRCSDGLLIIDHIALAAGLPLLNPIKDTTADFKHGANFAVAGATAISTPVLAGKKIINPVTTSSLDIQLKWMKNHFNSLCGKHKDCGNKLQNALFMVGEIGGNDYNYAFFSNKTLEEVQDLVPQVVDSIKDAVKKVISFGARKIVVPGNFPIGCLPIYLTGFQTHNLDDYDKNHCLKGLNSFAMYHNELLQKAIDELQKENPQVIILYGDYYNAYEQLLRQPAIKGFERLRACCGAGGTYNFNGTQLCGYPGVKACPDPSRYFSWDGIHLTQETYHRMTDLLLGHFFKKFNCFL